jgi:small GTP-binding protein
MGLSISKLLESWHGENDMSILMLGLDAAGKTSILYKIRLEEAVSPPTIGYGFETIKYKSIRFTVWDLGGYEKIRVLWKHYY